MAEESDPFAEALSAIGDDLGVDDGGGGSSSLDRLANPSFDDDISSQARENDASKEAESQKSSSAASSGNFKKDLESRSKGNVDIDFLLDLKLEMTFEVGRSKLKVSDLLSLGQGSVIELHRLVGENLDLLVNGHVLAKGEVVVVHEKFGVRIIEILDQEERVKLMGAKIKT